MRVCILIRGVSGASKSTFAQLLQSLCANSVVCEADEFFIDSKGIYRFDASKLFEAHSMCKGKFVHSINNNVELVIISNTSCKSEDVNYYKNKAEQANYRFFSIVMEKRHEGINQHNVSSQVIERQFTQLKQNLKLK